MTGTLKHCGSLAATFLGCKEGGEVAVLDAESEKYVCMRDSESDIRN